VTTIVAGAAEIQRGRRIVCRRLGQIENDLAGTGLQLPLVAIGRRADIVSSPIGQRYLPDGVRSASGKSSGNSTCPPQTASGSLSSALGWKPRIVAVAETRPDFAVRSASSKTVAPTRWGVQVIVPRSLVWRQSVHRECGLAGKVYSSGGLPPASSCDRNVPAGRGRTPKACISHP